MGRESREGGGQCQMGAIYVLDKDNDDGEIGRVYVGTAGNER